jgi:hypothetical protein
MDMEATAAFLNSEDLAIRIMVKTAEVGGEKRERDAWMTSYTTFVQRKL